jgi:hypothetical protein
MRYAFDLWMAREYPGVRFERYCDDVVVHCRSPGAVRILSWLVPNTRLGERGEGEAVDGVHVSGRTRWRVPAEGVLYRTPAMADGAVYLVDD